MSQLLAGTTQFEVDQEGFLCHAEEWNKDIAVALAQHEGIHDLNQTKLDIVHYLREYYLKNHSFPILRYVCKKVHATSSNCVTEEFTDPMKAWKIAGLPKPPQIFFTSFDGKNFFANPFY